MMKYLFSIQLTCTAKRMVTAIDTPIPRVPPMIVKNIHFSLIGKRGVILRYSYIDMYKTKSHHFVHNCLAN